MVQLFEENSCNSIKCREKKMARPKKNGTYLNVCIETPIYEMCIRDSQSFMT